MKPIRVQLYYCQDAPQHSHRLVHRCLANTVEAVEILVGLGQSALGAQIDVEELIITTAEPNCIDRSTSMGSGRYLLTRLDRNPFQDQ